jgi:hypothetical protein
MVSVWCYHRPCLNLHIPQVLQFRIVTPSPPQRIKGWGSKHDPVLPEKLRQMSGVHDKGAHGLRLSHELAQQQGVAVAIHQHET